MARRKTLFISFQLFFASALFILASSPLARNANAQSGTAAPTQAATGSESRIIFVDVINSVKGAPNPISLTTFLDPISKDTHYLIAPAGLTLTYAVPSPDGQWLAIVANDVKDSKPTQESLYLSKMDGSEMQQLSYKPDQPGATTTLSQPVWSTDSKQLLYFVSTFTVAGLRFQALGGVIKLATIDGSNPVPQTIIQPDTTVQFSNLLWPAWSPDGKTILFSPFSTAPSADTGLNVLWQMDVDGKHAMPFKERGRLPAWSPDGSHIALLNPAGTIEITDADGSNPKKVVTVSDKDVEALTWSPDGTQLAYLIFKPGKSPLTVINVDGSKATVVRELKGFSIFLDWALVPSQMVAALPKGTPTFAPTPTRTPIPSRTPKP